MGDMSNSKETCEYNQKEENKNEKMYLYTPWSLSQSQLNVSIYLSSTGAYGRLGKMDLIYCGTHEHMVEK